MATKPIRSAAVEAFERNLIKSGKETTEKWQKYLDASGAPAIEGETNRYVMAQMLENESNGLRTAEAAQTTSVFGSNYVPAMLGMTRQIFPRMFGTNLVAVQPLDRPSGEIFHLALQRDDGSSLGIRPQDSAADWTSANLLASRTYADHGTQDASQAPGEGDAIQKGMKLAITQSSVQIGKTKKLKTEATMELVQDLQAYHNLNALDLLQGAAVDEIAAEIDAMLVKAVYDAATANKVVTFGTTAPSGEGWTKKEWLRELPMALIKADRYISKVSLRRPNYIVCGFNAIEYLMRLNNFEFAANPDWDAGQINLSSVGFMKGATAYQVYVSRFVPDDEILLGRKGSGFLDAGVVYSPYIPLFISDRFFDNNTQTTNQSYASRFGITTVSTTLYGKVVIDSSTGIN